MLTACGQKDTQILLTQDQNIDITVKSDVETDVVQEAVPEKSIPEDPDEESTIDESTDESTDEDEKDLVHLAYWTTATDIADWPDLSEFDIVECHNDPDENGDAKVVFLVGDISETDLQLTYFNGYSGNWSESVKNQIITEVQDSVRPHVPGFTLVEVETIYIP